MNTDSRHSRESGNPAKIKPRACPEVVWLGTAAQHHNCVSRREDNLINWIPACAGMTEHRLLSIILTLLLATPSAQADELGRLFFTPAQRAQLNHHSYKPTTTVTNTDAAADAPEENNHTLTVNGIVQRNGGKRTAWINGTAKSVEQSDDNTSVMVTLPDQNKMIRLKVGQHITVSPPANTNAAKPNAEKPAPANDD